MVNLGPIFEQEFWPNNGSSARSAEQTAQKTKLAAQGDCKPEQRAPHRGEAPKKKKHHFNNPIILYPMRFTSPTLFLMGLLLFLGLTLQAQNRKRLDTSRSTWYEEIFKPSISYGLLMPKQAENFGRFHGPLVEVVIVNYAQSQAKSKAHYDGPTKFKIYSKLGVLQSDKSGIGNMLLYGFGGQFTLLNRRSVAWFDPFYGLEFGGCHQRDLGPSLQFTPHLGLHVFSHQSLQFSLMGGYTIMTKHYDQFSGFYAAAQLSLSIWGD